VKETYRRESGAAHEVAVEANGPLAARVTTGDLDLALTVAPLSPGRFLMSDGSRTWRVCVDRDGAFRHVTVEGVGEARFEREARGRRRRESAEGTLASPMPGTVVKVLVRAGERVTKGQELLVVEAMKMEIKVAAPSDGVVKSVYKGEGEPCDAGETLVEVEKETASP
jgi:biotin carboxyl carrier protein